MLIFVTGIVLGQDNVVSFMSSNLPIVVIDTEGRIIQDDPKILASMGIIDNGPGILNNVTDPFNNYQGRIGISIRGSSSQMFPKKQYSIELRNADDKDLEAPLMGMPKEEDWVLFAPYNDKSLMRDVLAYKLGNDMGQYAPRTRFCEVMLNGRYQGVYVLIEKIKRDKNRVDINKLDPEEITGDNLTGGYILKIDKTTGDSGEGWKSSYSPTPHPRDQQISFQYEVPKHDEIVAEQKQYIQQYISQFEDALAGENFKDPVNGYAKYIDVNSFVDYFLTQELSKNIDGFRLSTFLYKQRDSDGGKLFMGPIWDFNLGFGNADYCTSGEAEGFVYNFNFICSDDSWLIPFWWGRLLQDENFRIKVGDRWSELRASKWKEAAILSYIDSIAAVLNEGAQQRNFEAWSVLNKYIWPNFYVGSSHVNEVTWLKDWVSDRLVWLDENLSLVITDTERDEKGNASVIAYPNPFSTQVTFKYTLQRAGQVDLRLFDTMGRVAKAVSLNHEAPGQYFYSWETDATNSFYYYKMEQSGEILGIGKLSKRAY
jgi:hypothetical protein